MYLWSPVQSRAAQDATMRNRSCGLYEHASSHRVVAEAIVATFACREAKGIVSRCLFSGPSEPCVQADEQRRGGTRRGCLPGATWETPVAESGRSCSRYFFLPSRSSVISATATTAVMGSSMSISFLRACDQIARYGRDRTARLEHEPHTTVHQLIWVLLRSSHDE
jgi:hypothetical protein